MGHDHHTCKETCGHENVKFCPVCDVAYCMGCKREWGHCKLAHYPYVYTYPQYTHPNWTTTTAADSTTFTDGSESLTASGGFPHSHA